MDTITEPTTLLTDYLLAAFTAWLAVQLSGPGSQARRWWSVGFAASALAGAAGGTVHGFRNVLPSATIAALWLLTLEAIVFAGLAVVLATLASTDMADGARRRLAAVACVTYATYALWIPAHPQFVFAILGYAAALAVLTFVYGSGWVPLRWGNSGRLLAGVGISVIAALVQQSGWALHRHFNHNDLFHVIQGVAMWVLYRGASSSAERVSASVFR